MKISDYGVYVPRNVYFGAQTQECEPKFIDCVDPSIKDQTSCCTIL